MIVGHSLKNDISPALRTIPAKPLGGHMEMEASPNPRAVSIHKDAIDAVRQNQQFSPNMPAATLNFDGILFPGVGCNCAPPDTNGEVGADAVRPDGQRGLPGLQQDDGASVLGPSRSRRSGPASAAYARLNGDGDPVVLYDQLANRWLITQFAGASVPTDECIAVSTTSDATGTWTATTSTSARTSSTIRSSASGRTPTTWR